jgi:hypothetical protein
MVFVQGAAARARVSGGRAELIANKKGVFLAYLGLFLQTKAVF